MTFTTAQIAGGNRVLVQGTDAFGVTGSTVVDSTEWDSVKQHQALHVAQDEFDAAVEEFFAPIEAAMAALDKAVERPERDAINYVVLHDGIEGVDHVPAQIQKLSKDSVILRVIEQGDYARLVWVGDELEVLEVAVTVAPQQSLPADADPA